MGSTRSTQPQLMVRKNDPKVWKAKVQHEDKPPGAPGFWRVKFSQGSTWFWCLHFKTHFISERLKDRFKIRRLTGSTSPSFAKSSGFDKARYSRTILVNINNTRAESLEQKDWWHSWWLFLTGSCLGQLFKETLFPEVGVGTTMQLLTMDWQGKHSWGYLFSLSFPNSNLV